ncbi:MAG: hypothetical protein JOZ42_12920, partial [Acetobacteraceae bacterium]|nr:hypothetical protein [Acetobacteraceae bacterium]
MATELKEARARGAGRQALFALGTPRTPIVAHRVWSAALEKALAALDSGRTLVAILGPEGVGKTTLLHEIEQTQNRGGNRRITVIDDADRLGNADLRALADSGKGPFLLAGRPELSLELSLVDPTAAIVSMGRIWQADIPAYLEALCVQTGQARALIEPAAADRLSVVSEGLPGALTSVARMAALVAAAAGADHVQPEHVDRAVRLYERPDAVPASSSDLLALLEEREPRAAQSVRENAAPLQGRGGRAAFLPKRRSLGLAAMAVAAAAWLTAGALWLERHTASEGAATGQHPPPTAQMTAGVIPPAQPAAAPASTAPLPQRPVPPAQPQVIAEPPPAAAPTPAPQAAAPAPQPPPTAVAAAERPVPPVAAAPAPAPVARQVTETAPPLPIDVGALPAFAPPRVFVSYAAGSTAAQSKATIVAAALRAHGFAAAEPLPAASERERGSVGFYFFEDRDAAAAVQAAVPLPLDAPGLLPLTHGE